MKKQNRIPSDVGGETRRSLAAAAAIRVPDRRISSSKSIEGDERDALFHALDIAQRTLAEDIEMWKHAEPNALVTAQGVIQMRELFAHYLDRLNRLRDRLESADRIDLVKDGGAL